MVERYIVGTSGAYHSGVRTDVEYGPLARYAVDLAGVNGRAPKFGYLATASGDQKARLAERAEAARLQGWQFNPLTVFMMPNVEDPREYLLDQDVIWVDGGSVVNLLALWRAHGLDDIMREAWEKGIVLAGVSAGSMCWHIGGATDSFGPELRKVSNGLALLPYGNGVHYGVNPLRRIQIGEMVSEGVFERAYSSEDGIGLVYRGTELVEVISDRDDVYGWNTFLDGDEVVEERMVPRRLPD
ncbi:MAG: peptidase E [Actinomycetaceae bacterium]|nr:peptidase E [Actinomycetaceae bacterium]